MKVELTLLPKIHECITREATGCPDCFAAKFGISKRLLHNVLEFFKKTYNAPIAYSRLKQTYYYTEEWDFYIGDLKSIKSKLIKGILEAIDDTVKVLVLLSFISF